MFSTSRALSSLGLKYPVLDVPRRQVLMRFQKNAGLRFGHLELLDLAFCHRSFVNETSVNVDNNERLEFLGDSVLGMVVSDYLFRFLPERPEGELARIKSHVVSEDSLAAVALSIGVDITVRVGRGEELSGGRKKKALLSDTMEAIIGACYLDAGYEKASKFILNCLRPTVDTVLADKHRKDYKTLLQEIVQKRFHSYPRYILEKNTGPDHQRIFWMKVVIQGEEYGPGKGSNKKSSEQEAARIAWKTITGND